MSIHDAALNTASRPTTSNKRRPGRSVDDDSPACRLRLGFDTQGRLLETVALVFDSGKELVIHAMKARPQMLDLLP